MYYYYMIKKIGVIGIGTMGRGIIETFAKNNYKIIGININPNTYDSNLSKLDYQLKKNNLLNIKKNIKLTKNLDDINDCDLVIESIKEDFQEKETLFKRINSINKSCILATNTSSLSINSLKDKICNKDKFIGLHFFNPVPKMKLIEVVKSNDTSVKTTDICIDLINSINYEPVLCNDSEGFIINKLLIPQIVNAVSLHCKNIASVADIDKAMKIGLGHPMGPLKLSDFIGNDVVLSIYKNINKGKIDDCHEAVNLLEKMVNKNRLGKKSGKGFYNWK